MLQCGGGDIIPQELFTRLADLDPGIFGSGQDSIINKMRDPDPCCQNDIGSGSGLHSKNQNPSKKLFVLFL